VYLTPSYWRTIHSLMITRCDNAGYRSRAYMEEAAITNKMLGFVVPSELTKSIGYGSYEKVIDLLEGAVSDQQYIAGNEFSAADVYVGSQIGLGLQFGSIEKRPAFEKYWERLSLRQAYIRTQEIEAKLV